MNISKIKEKLSEKELEELARQTGFLKSSRYTISPYAYVIGFFQMLHKNLNTVEVWGSEISKLTNSLISPQAVQQRIQYPQADFCKALLATVMRQELNYVGLLKQCDEYLAPFNQVYVEDSTCITLPKCLFGLFPGSVNQQGCSSSARIQLRIELKRMEYKAITVQSYRDNDQKFASDIMNQVGQGDLVIRDLGYYSTKVLQQMTENGVYFLSRFLPKTALYDPKDGHEIDIIEELRELNRKGIKCLDKKVLLGKETKVPVRLVAIKATPKIKRQRKKKANRDRRKKKSKEYMELLGWTLLITNVPEKVWSNPMKILKIYAFRWRIEIIFRCWKQHLNFKRLLKTKNSLSPPRAEINFYLILIWLTICYAHLYNLLFVRVYQATGRILSMQKFAAYLAGKDDWLNLDQIDEQEVKYLARYFSQTKRKEKSQTELLYMINFC